MAGPGIIWGKVRRFVAEHGVLGLLDFLACRTVKRLAPKTTQAIAEWQLRRWLAHQPADKRPYILCSTLDWNYPYWQRPHHLALALAALGHPVVFVTPDARSDRLLSLRSVSPSVALISSVEAALAVLPAPALLLLSTDTRWNARHLGAVRAAGGVVVYDYLDALDDSLSFSPITTERRALHDALLADEAGTVVISVSDILAEEVAGRRRRHHGLVTNGVDLVPFLAATRRLALRPDLAAVVALQRPIIGYYGSLAAWLDYPLLMALAAARPTYEVVVLGPDIDGSGKALAGGPANLHVLPGIAYGALPQHGIWFDVCLVPFLINEITLATSPLKIFEYMAMGAPIVSTAMPECRKYASVAVAENHDAFIALVDRALADRDDPNLREARLAEARANSWQGKAIYLSALAEGLLLERERRP
jgi:teichuronic acid biosynthesis glycosyltransferase TuaH